MNAFFAIFKKELKAITKESTIVIAILIQLFIASFSSALLAGLMSVYDPEARALSARLQLKIGLIGDASNPLVGYLEDYHARISTYSTPEEADDAFRTGQINALLFIPDAVLVDGESIVHVKLFLPESETLSMMVLMVIKEPLKQYENDLRKETGVQLRYRDLEGEPSTIYEFRYGVILPLLMFFPAFVTGGLVVDSISEEIAKRTLDTLWAAPLSLNTIFSAKIAAALFIAGGQCVLWIALLRFNGIVIQNLGLVLLLAIMSAALIAVSAAFIAVYLKDRERSQFIYSLFILLVTSLSYFFDASPIALTTRLSTGDYYAGFGDVAVYAVLLLLLLGVFFSTTKRLIAAAS